MAQRFLPLLAIAIFVDPGFVSGCSSPTSFPIDFTGIQCHGLSEIPGTDVDSCVASCCAESSCTLYQWCPATNSACRPSGTCWIGNATSIGSCFPSPGWESRGRAQPTGPFPVSNSAGYWPFPYAGIGAISGGGATSNLLLSYAPELLSELFDYLFLPNFGAALQILKVEIGGGATSTEGSEASHWRSREEAPAFDRGYEWRIMVEAKKRNPDIILYGLPWTFPGWIQAAGGAGPFSNVTAAVEYIVAWVAGAKSAWNLTVDVLGIWNERQYSPQYVIALRAGLDDAGFASTRIVCDDGRYACVADMMTNPVLAAAVSIIGGHGPPPADAYTLGKPLWWSEDYHATTRFGDPAQWAFQINRRFLQNNCTTTIAWNAIDAFLEQMDFDNSGLMVARWPWSGHYEVLAPIWATAHTTQFTRAGWSYLLNNTGGGSLAFGGSYVTIVDASAPPSTPTWSIVIEKMCSSNYPVCNVEEASFCLGGSLAGNGSGNLTLALWQSVFLGGDGSNDTYLSNLGNLSVSASSPCFSVLVPANTMMTVTTTGWGGKGQHATPPPLAPFPLQYADDFSSCSPPSSARYFSDITGEFECAPSAASRSGLVMRQMTPAPPVSWEHDFRPHGVIGNATWTNVNATFVAIFPAAAPSPTTLMVAVRAGFLNATNYNALLAEEASPGLWFTLASDGGWNLTSSIVNATEAAGLILKGTSPVPVQPLTPIAISLVAVGDLLHASIGGAVAIDGLDVSNFQYSGFVGYGCILYGSCADFASISIDATV